MAAMDSDVFKDAFEDVFEILVLQAGEYLKYWKRDGMAWRRVLNNHFQRSKVAGGPIITSIQDHHTITSAIGDKFHCKLSTPNGLEHNDGKELTTTTREAQDTQQKALEIVCWRAITVLLLTDAIKVLLQPAQWKDSPSVIVKAAVKMKQ